MDGTARLDTGPAGVPAAPPATSPSVPFIGSIGTRSPAERLGVAVVRELVNAIVTGEVLPGASLPPEGSLSSQFGVSRTVIRESVKRLEEKGLVEVAQGRGTQVTPMSVWNMLDPVVLGALVENDDSLGTLDELSVVRGSLEATMAGATATSRTADQLQRLQDALELMRSTLDDHDAFRQADIVFHDIVIELSGNRLAENIAKVLFRRAIESARYHGVDQESAFAKTLEEHQRIFEAISEQDADGAELAMRRHIADAWQRRRLPTHRAH